jgi:hypothetical protein
VTAISGFAGLALHLPAAGENLISGECARIIAMLLTLAVVGVVGVLALGISLVVRVKRRRDQRDLEQHSITADELHALLASDPEVLLFDVRQPLDLLAYPEVIPKAERIAPD